MIRVAFFAEILKRNYDGATRTMFQIIDRIDESEFEFIFLCGLPPEETIPQKVYRFPVLRIPFQKNYYFVNPLFKKRRIHNILDEFQPNVIHIASPSLMGRMAASYGKKNQIPVLSIYHTHYKSYVQYYFRKVPFLTGLVRKYVVSRTKAFYNRCDLMLVPTKSIKNEMRKDGIQKKKIKIWARGIDSELFSPNKRNELYIDNITQNSFPNILFVSRLVWEKNLQLLIDIYNKSEAYNLKRNFIIVGDGLARKKLEKKMPKAFFFGHVDHKELSKIYASCDYFIFPSTSETYGNVLLEAMASGIPVIAANGGSNVDLIQHGSNGFLCQIGNADNYLRMIKILNEQPTLRQLMVKRGLQVAANSSWDLLIERYFLKVRKLAKTVSTGSEIKLDTVPAFNFEVAS